MKLYALIERNQIAYKFNVPRHNLIRIGGHFASCFPDFATEFQENRVRAKSAVWQVFDQPARSLAL
jgi:hypothetical protein